MNRLLHFFVLLFITNIGLADSKEDYLYEYLNVSNGLSNNSVTRVVKDHLGQLWFASSEGIVKLDAQGFEYFKPSKRYDQLISEDIETLELGANNILWVGTKSGGLSAYDIAKDQFTSYNHLFEKYIPKNSYLRIISLKETSSGHLYVGTWYHGFFVIDLNTGELIFHRKDKKVIQSIIEVNNGNIWYGTSGSLYEYDVQERKVKKHIVDKVRWITKLTYDKNRDLIYFGSSTSLNQFDLKTHINKKISGKNSDKLRLINSLLIDKQGRLWVGTWKDGLYRSNPEKTHFTKIDLLPDAEINKNYEGITDILIDDLGIIWITTTHGGVVRLTENRGIYKVANSHRENIGFTDNNINSIYVDSNNNQWIGTKNGGLVYKSASDNNYKEITVTKNQLINAFQEINGSMYVGASNGLYIFPLNDPNKKHQLFGSTRFRKIKSIYHDQPTKSIWFGLQQSGLATIKSDIVFSLDQITFYAPDVRKENKFVSDRVEHIIAGNNNSIWIGSYHGLFRWNTITNKYQFIDLKSKFDFPSNIILSLYTTPSLDTLFVGSAKGLLVLDNTGEELQFIDFFDQSSGLENDCINAITLDNKGLVWLGLSKGISNIDLSTNTIQNYIKEDGVNVSSINIDAVFNTNDLIYFGGQKGLLVFSPQFLDTKKTIPQLYFSNLFIDNKNISVGDSLHQKIILDKILAFTKEIDLTYREKVIRLDFNTNNYIDQKNITYYYRVKSISDQWINNQHTTSITFTQLPVGENIIEIKGCKNGECGESTQLQINISPAPWQTTTAYVIYVIVVLIIFYGVFSFFIRKEKLENKIKLVNIEKEKEHEITEAKVRFFTNISHEIRTPLTLIHSPLEEILEEEDLPNKYRTKLQIINKNANSLLVLVNQLLDFRKVENNKITLSYQFVSLKKLIENKCWEFQSLIQTAGLKLDFQTQVSENQLYKLDQEKIEIVINNLISNAIKFTPRGKKITVNLEVNEKIKISIRDEGVGIKTEDLDAIFTRYYQGSTKELTEQRGTGIGLSLSKNIINLHDGEIYVESTENEGSTFIIELPIIETKESEVENKIEDRPINKNNTLLLVDDNHDILQYLESIFTDQYHILTATNGKEGLDIMNKQDVDCVISDVMMPVMDGLTFCKEVKGNPELQHIPFLLLTANATTENELESLGLGANDFLRKPFNSKVIKEKVKNLLAYKLQLIAFYRSTLNPIQKAEPKIDKPLTEDEKFIQNAVQFIEDNIDNDELNVEVLAHHMAMSQSTIYRKLKALTNNTIVGFIRSVRLKKAAQLILETDDSIKVIAENVGINDVRYFNREFKKQYEVDPSVYKEYQLDDNT
ncbi:ATP-binding protein [Flammeovirga sp. SubArs3]|uniref:hybrid sensor histidine kinase/response regulator transcription factor n=1 Tax=Flammeovirga sp. SubArs3 TaxID=2995316 RepID=UPI00248C159F|nr:ATP-binding protein [Flammeovirga sp. SubArs3]